MNIRKSCLYDIDLLLANRLEFFGVVRNHEVVFPEGFEEATREYMMKHMEDNSLVIWIAEDNGVICSIAMVCYYQLLPSLSNPGGNTGYIQNVYTLPDYRGKGFASKLIKNIIQDAKDRKVGRLILHATDMGKVVYEKLGFDVLTNEMMITVE
jgi:GNAT superfamily N-acetyltransferase